MMVIILSCKLNKDKSESEQLIGFKEEANIMFNTSDKVHIKVVKYLIEHCHADVETKNEHGMASLNCASYKGHMEVTKYLVEKGDKKHKSAFLMHANGIDLIKTEKKSRSICEHAGIKRNKPLFYIIVFKRGTIS